MGKCEWEVRKKRKKERDQDRTREKVTTPIDLNENNHAIPVGQSRARPRRESGEIKRECQSKRGEKEEYGHIQRSFAARFRSEDSNPRRKNSITTTFMSAREVEGRGGQGQNSMKGRNVTHNQRDLNSVDSGMN